MAQLIKILLGIFVVVVVVVGISFFFSGTVIDFFKNLVGVEEEGGEYGGAGASGDIAGEDSGDVGGEEAEEDALICYEDSDCTNPAEDLICRGGDVKGYLYKCTRKGECVRKTFREEIQQCDYGCTNAECICLPSGTIVKLIGNPHRSWCCDGYYRLERGQWRCN